MITCNYCKYFYGSEYSVLARFKEECEPTHPSGFACSVRLSNEGGTIKMCHHPSCFSINNIVTPENRLKTSKYRVRGQAQLNKDNNCRYFKKTVFRRILDLFNLS